MSTAPVTLTINVVTPAIQQKCNQIKHQFTTDWYCTQPLGHESGRHWFERLPWADQDQPLPIFDE
jgi:hypothetical protein